MTAFLSVFFFFKPAYAGVRLVKLKDSPTVYYLNGQRTRHIFPNEATYRSWYGNDFSQVVIVSEEFLSKIPLGKNITLRPGKYLVKIPTSPKVYFVEAGGVLRHIEHEGIAEQYYGENWEDRLIDLPEVFFQDYQIGEPIRFEGEIPDSVMYAIEGQPTYYWKINNVVWPLASEKVIFENGYTLDDVIVGSRVYYRRRRVISGRSEKIFNPLAEPLQSNADCENKNLRAAVIFLVKDSATVEELDRIQQIKGGFPSYYRWATQDLSQIDLSYPTIILKDDGYLISGWDDNKKETKIYVDETASTFYDSHPDIFDFLIIFTNFDALNHNENALFIPVTNRVEGIGKMFLESGEIYGSLGKLKGIIIMDNINEIAFSDTREQNRVFNYLLHEILHQWSGSIYFQDESGELNASLLRQENGGRRDYAHWSFYVDFVSPLGGSGWQENGDGTFTSQISQMQDSQKKPLSQLDLYLMGLLPYQVIDPVHFIIPDIPERFDNTISGTKVQVTIDDIIAANGHWRCVLE